MTYLLNDIFIIKKIELKNYRYNNNNNIQQNDRY